jgi:septum formation protein
MKKLTDGEIEAYVSTGEPFGKAGAYAVQGKGAIFVDGIEGCYYNVVGLPLPKLADMLKKFGVTLMQ